MYHFSSLLFFSLTLFFPQSALADASGDKRVKPLSRVEMLRYTNCATDRDCIYVQNGCCDCANGGQDVAVNKLRLEEFKSQFDCREAACTRRAAVTPCGSGVVSCIERRCRYLSTKGKKPFPVKGP